MILIFQSDIVSVTFLVFVFLTLTFLVNFAIYKLDKSLDDFERACYFIMSLIPVMPLTVLVMFLLYCVKNL